MDSTQQFLNYYLQICQGTLSVPGISLPEGDPETRNAALQAQISQMGLPAFLAACQAAAAASPDCGSQQGEEAAPSDPGPSSSPCHGEGGEDSVPPQEAEEAAPGKKQNAYEAMLDCLALEDNLVDYLIEVLKAQDELAFFRLSQITVRRELRLHDFLFWFATKELYAGEEERGCVTVLDALLERLAQEGELETAAALISGDRTTFELIRAQAPELRQAPAATYEWFETNYLDRYYPLRMICRLRGVRFPEIHI